MELPKLPGLPALPSVGEIPPMTAPTLAAGSFQCGPDDDVATADIYKLKSAMGAGIKPITSIQELTASIPDATFKFALTEDKVADFMSAAKGAAVFDKDLLTARILGTSSEFKASFNELDAMLKKGALTNTFNDKASKFMCTINDTKSMVDSANINSVKALGSFVNKYTGTPIFSGQDKGAIAGLLGSVVTTSSKLGISGAFTSLAQTVNDNGIMGRVTRAVLPIAMKNSDTRLLREISSGTTGSLINVFSPGFTQSFSKNFTYRSNGPRPLGTFEDVFHSFENIDNQWDSLPRGEEGNTAFNLLAIMGGSRDFQSLVMTGVKYWMTEKTNNPGTIPPVRVDPMMSLANIFQEITVGQAIKRDFPKVALLSVYDGRLNRTTGLPTGTRNSMNSNFLDPRTINGALGALFGS